ncbi:hypothetical protein ACFXG1_19230 [Streptomyces sp. NPDC059248]|uniref:hypothetical protein n=1 Tax=Streptomyces sp. NPDC059248 TaxID=3346791 RepID=UPI0036B27FEB
MTKTQRILTAVALAAGASALSVSGASAAGHHTGGQSPEGVQSLTDGVSSLQGGLKELNQLNQLMEVPNALAPLIDPVAQVAGAIQ